MAIDVIAALKPAGEGYLHNARNDVATIQERALAAAGFTPETIGALVRLAAAKLEEQLSATKVQFFSKDGVVQDQRVVEDSMIQQNAAKALLDLGVDIAGLSLKNSSTGGAKTAITFNLSGWIKEPEVAPVIDIEVTPVDSPSI